MSAPTPAPSAYSRTNPFPAPLIENRRLNKEGSSKDTRHFVISLKNSGLVYKPGDSLGVFAQNPPALVDDLLARLHLDGSVSVAIDTKGTTATLRQALLANYILNRVGKKFVRTVAEKLPAGPDKDRLTALCADEEALSAYIFDRDYVDVLNEYPGAVFTPEELLGTINKTAPRLYSIASSLAKHPEEVHLTVAVVTYTTHNRKKYGLASGYMAEFVPLNETLPVFVQSSKHFHLPEDKATDMIMVGPGTGIAPFRAFLEQREMDGSTGRNWLFFGDQHKATDFLYEDEFADYQKKGILHRLDTAFSRDQATKIYVQDRMKENGAELWNWISNGAYFYVCGDAKRMAKDVHQALIDIVQQHGGLSAEAAAEYVNVTLMKTEKRYLRDVY
jgi:sulfite reductase (NADPH) flavoprotein alpha-component